MLALQFNIVNSLVLIAAFFPVALGLFVFLSNTSYKPGRSFFYFTLSATVWAIVRLFAQNTIDIELAKILFSILYFVAALMPFTFFYFTIDFTELYDKEEARRKILIATILFLLETGVIIFGMIIYFIPDRFQHLQPVFYTPLFMIYVFSFFSLFVWSYFLLYKKLKSVKKALKKNQMRYIIFGTLIAVSIGIIANLLLPLFDIFSMAWIGPISTAVASSIIVYGMSRYSVFGAKVILAQITIFGLWMIILIRLLLSQTITDLVVQSITLFAVGVIGVLLIKSMNKEIRSRERLEKLTQELKKSNRRLKQLDQMKTEFLSIATHQLRTPLTSIKGYLSMILEGEYGKVPNKINKTLAKVFKSASLMTETITDFMNVSRIELNHMEYYKKDFLWEKIMKEVVDELAPKARQAGLKLILNSECGKKGEHPIVYGDYGKIKYIFSNLIENAIKYTPSGSISVYGRIDKKRKIVKTVIEDTGIGIAKDELKDLFAKFKRARNAYNINIKGTGLGLYVAKKMVEAHNGKVWAESDGVGKGSRFCVELPFKDLKFGNKE